MYNQKKIEKLKKLGWGVSLIFLIVLCISIGFNWGKNKQKTEQKPTKQEVVEKKNEVTTEIVQKFLIAYYTRKDLGENRPRYKPLVTTSMYTELTTEEDQPVNQAYKGYVVNQVLDSSDIYINTEMNTAICIVNYKNTQRTKINNDEGALINQNNQEAIKLTFSETGKNYLVDRIEPMTVTNVLNTNKNSYKTTTTTETEEFIDRQEVEVSTINETEESSHE